MSASPTLVPGASYLSVLAEVPGSLAERVVGWRAERGLVGPAVETCHITVLIGADQSGESLLEVLAGRLACLKPFEVTLGSPLSFEPVTPVTYLPVVGGAWQLARAHTLCTEVVGPSVSPFPYEPHVTLAHQNDPAILRASIADFSDLPHELTRFAVSRLGVYRFVEGGWEALGIVSLG
ncbi:2'-5' RNA ligase family protein [Rothia sp. CCM 9417]|uniref:2'-5' RNA ligase family protein n=1 Tax=unclassified Rothia (in: high G+C Gram-positive bacteria) TaxID=2689056 RepID=UPI003AE1A6E9